MHLTDARTHTGAAAMDAATTSGKRQQQHVHSFISSPLSFVFSHVRTLPLMHWEQIRLTKYVKRQQWVQKTALNTFCVTHFLF